jgi:hypothetical protein
VRIFFKIGKRFVGIRIPNLGIRLTTTTPTTVFKTINPIVLLWLLGDRRQRKRRRRRHPTTCGKRPSLGSAVHQPRWEGGHAGQQQNSAYSTFIQACWASHEHKEEENFVKIEEFTYNAGTGGTISRSRSRTNSKSRPAAAQTRFFLPLPAGHRRPPTSFAGSGTLQQRRASNINNDSALSPQSLLCSITLSRSKTLYFSNLYINFAPP